MIYYGFKSVAKFPRSNLKNLGFAANGMAQVIKSLFANNEQGFAFDFNDLSTMYQDSAGTIPVTGVGQPVGLVLDKSKNLQISGEKVIDDDFNTPSAWNIVGTNSTNTINLINGAATFNITDNTSSAMLRQLTSNLVAGKCYEVTVVVSSYTKGSITINGLNTSTLINSKETAKTKVIMQSSILVLTPTPNTQLTIESISMKEITGNHAYQSTSAKRPILKSSPTQLNYDGIDDVMTVNLPTQLTGCTVIRAVPNVGAQILTNQTIAAPYNSNTTNSGLIVVNRALTSEETTRVTQVFNKLVGV